jgi:hypothetical protein
VSLDQAEKARLAEALGKFINNYSLGVAQLAGVISEAVANQILDEASARALASDLGRLQAGAAGSVSLFIASRTGGLAFVDAATAVAAPASTRRS